MLVNKFLYSVITNDDISTLFRIKDSFVVPKDLLVVDFVKDCYTKHSKLPDIDTVESKFNIELTPNTESTQFWYDEILSAYKNRVVEDSIIDAAKNKGKAIDIFQKAILSYNTDIDSSVSTYSDSKRRIDDYNNRKSTGGISYLSTGCPEYDSFSLGYKRSDLWTIGGREGIGKTWLLLRMANWVDMYLTSNDIDRTILIVSGEMDAVELEERLDAMRCEVSYNLLSRGDLSPTEERKYKRYLMGVDSRVVIVDSFDNLKDVQFLITVYNPIICFIDGSHLLASSYEWTDIARVTSTMKKITRNNKLPIVNTTHLKSEKGKSATGGDIDDFAYTKGYTRDSDIAGVMFADDMMEIDYKFGIDWVKVRRGGRCQLIFQNDYDKTSAEIIEVKQGVQVPTNGGTSTKTAYAPSPTARHRNGQKPSFDED